MLNCTPFHKGMGALVSHSGGKCHLQGPRLPVETCAAVWPPAPMGVMCGKGGWVGESPAIRGSAVGPHPASSRLSSGLHS